MAAGLSWPRAELALCALCSILSFSHAVYLPGVAPTEYKEGDPVDLKVNKLTSVKTQLPYSYYVLPYCQPPVIQKSTENLGEILTGDMIENSPYELKMLQNVSCRILCQKVLQTAQTDKFRSMIDDDYLVNWFVDNLPVATRVVDPRGSHTYREGFPVGRFANGKYYVMNHVRLEVQYHSEPTLFEGYRIVGVDVQPSSIAHGASGVCEANQGAFELEANANIAFSYDVVWIESPIRWASRWDAYLKMTGASIHWFSIVNSLMVVLFLSGMVIMIIMRTLHRDISKYNEVATAEDAAEETGWKLVHGDVFRRPRFSKMLAVSFGSGLQILCMSVVTLVFALLGVLSPAHRGGLLQSMMLLFTFMGGVAGYSSSRMYKLVGGNDWKLTTLLTAIFYPGVVFFIFFNLNLLIWSKKSSGAVSFATMFALLVLWFGISVPLVFLGAYLGFRSPATELPVRVNQIARQIPPQPWYMRHVVMCAVGGILPFGAVFTELFFIMSSLWLHQFYYLFGFLALVLMMMILTCALISIALTYFQLTGENYNWWWRSFFSSATSSLYVFGYSVIYLRERLHIEQMVPMLLYFGYMLIITLLFGLLTGAIGLLSSLLFVRAIYGSIKID